MKKNLSVAFYWHMHQPVYELEGTYLMPWTRLHAVKDYLDMVLVLEKFPKLKLNFNIVPTIIDAIIDYTENGLQDIHSELSVIDVDDLTDEEKTFVLNNFFSAKFETMIYRSENYRNLYQKRFSKDLPTIEDFTNQEFSDLMALFNLVWIDTVHFERYPELERLWAKQYNYTQEDRKQIITIQKQIMSEIIPAYKKYLNEGRIEITTSPYYHVILPILLDMKSSLNNVITTKNLPEELNMEDDAREQIKKAINRIQEVFGIKPKGIWAPELCLSDKALDLLIEEGIEWTISDEGSLANSLDVNFVRDFKGNLNDPYKLLKVYQYGQDKKIDIVFRDRSIPYLINFEYAGINPKMAISDLYEKIKIIQDKILVSPDDKHLLTIALDSENCWENYQNDGREFLDGLYDLVEKDNSIETILFSEYLEKDNTKKEISSIFSGSWIDKTFRYWIGEKDKNKAWSYLKEAKDVLEAYKSSNNFDETKYNIAHNELMVIQGSDWYWWFGEPNNSGQDFIFDYMYRERLRKIYVTLDSVIPEYLDYSIISKIEIPFKHPTSQITPRMDGLNSSDSDWQNAGYFTMLDGPVFRENKNVDKINFGCDSQNIYFRLHINKDNSDNGFLARINQFYIYTRNATKVLERAHIRLISKTDNAYPILTEKFEHEITLTLIKDTLYPLRLATVINKDIWTLDNPDGIQMVYEDVIDLAIPFDKLNIAVGESVEFFLANTDSAVKNTYIPQEILITLTREN